MLRHNLIAYREDDAGISTLPHFDDDCWLDYVPIRLPEAISVRDRLPPGAAAALINQSHTDPDLVLIVDAAEFRLVEAIDGKRSVADIIGRLAEAGSSSRPPLEQHAAFSSGSGGTTRSYSIPHVRAHE